jgi:hypothetical protein
MNKISRIVSSGMVAGAIVGGGGLSAFAAEEGKSVYLLGVTTSMAGLTPPPGTYVSSFKYGYSGEETGGAAISRTLSRAGTEIPCAPAGIYGNAG